MYFKLGPHGIPQRAQAAQLTNRLWDFGYPADPCRTLVVGPKSAAFENFGFFSTGGGVLFLQKGQNQIRMIRMWEENLNRIIEEYKYRR